MSTMLSAFILNGLSFVLFFAGVSLQNRPYPDNKLYCPSIKQNEIQLNGVVQCDLLKDYYKPNHIPVCIKNLKK